MGHAICQGVRGARIPCGLREGVAGASGGYDSAAEEHEPRTVPACVANSRVNAQKARDSEAAGWCAAPSKAQPEEGSPSRRSAGGRAAITQATGTCAAGHRESSSARCRRAGAAFRSAGQGSNRYPRPRIVIRCRGCA
jgi:hypothetical protein